MFVAVALEASPAEEHEAVGGERGDQSPAALDADGHDRRGREQQLGRVEAIEVRRRGIGLRWHFYYPRVFPKRFHDKGKAGQIVVNLDEFAKYVEAVFF